MYFQESLLCKTPIFDLELYMSTKKKLSHSLIQISSRFHTLRNDCFSIENSSLKSSKKMSCLLSTRSHLDTSGGASESTNTPRSEPTEADQFDRVDVSDLGTKTSGESRPKLPSKQYALRDGRRFNIGYHDRYLWLEYSLETNGVY